MCCGKMSKYYIFGYIRNALYADNFSIAYQYAWACNDTQ